VKPPYGLLGMIWANFLGTYSHPRDWYPPIGGGFIDEEHKSHKNSPKKFKFLGLF